MKNTKYNTNMDDEARRQISQYLGEFKPSNETPVINIGVIAQALAINYSQVETFINIDRHLKDLYNITRKACLDRLEVEIFKAANKSHVLKRFLAETLLPSMNKNIALSPKTKPLKITINNAMLSNATSEKESEGRIRFTVKSIEDKSKPPPPSPPPTPQIGSQQFIIE